MNNHVIPTLKGAKIGELRKTKTGYEMVLDGKVRDTIKTGRTYYAGLYAGDGRIAMVGRPDLLGKGDQAWHFDLANKGSHTTKTGISYRVRKEEDSATDTLIVEVPGAVASERPFDNNYILYIDKDYDNL